jgi:hypothetical protein
MNTPTDIRILGPVIAAAYTLVCDDDGPDDGQVRDAFNACAEAGRRSLLRDMAAGLTFGCAAVAGIAASEARGALLDLGEDPDDAYPGLLAALADAYINAYRAH